MTIQLYDLVGEDKTRPFSPHCWKVKLALAHKQLDFTTNPVAFTDIPSIEVSVGKTVPVIRDGDEVLSDSFNIALYLDKAYPDRPTLFGGEGGEKLSKFVESWVQTTLHPQIAAIALMDIHDMLEPLDQIYFRKSREKAFGKPLEDVIAGRQIVIDGFADKLFPLRYLLKSQKYIGGDSPLFADYIAFGALQWLRICSGVEVLPKNNQINDWFERCLDLHDGLGRQVTTAGQ